MPHVLVAADADWVVEEVVAALAGPDTTFTICRSGKDVVPAVGRRTPDLAVLDLQIGNMGGMATCLALRLEESAGRLPHVPVLMLLDREHDFFLAQRSEAEGWLVKPLDSLRLRRAATAVMAGRPYRDGVAAPETPAEDEVAAPSGDEVATG